MSASPERDLVQLPLTRVAAERHGFAMWAGSDLPRSDSDVIIAKWCADQVLALNDWATPAQAQDAVRHLEALLAGTSTDNLVERSKQFLTAIRQGVQVRDGARKRSVRIIDLENPLGNRWDIATEVTYRTSGGVKAVRFDIVLYANGIPLVVVECKSMLDPHASWLTAAQDLAGPYTRRAPAFLASGLFQIATDGRQVRYGALKAPAQQYQRWGTTVEDRPSADTWEQVEWDFLALTDPDRLCSWAQDYILHMTDRSSGVLTRFVPRWTQAEAAPLMAARALDPEQKRGLLVHFQGSGKTLAMLMAANAILRRIPTHCVVVVVDRIDLLSQHKQDFVQSDARRSVLEAETAAQLSSLLSQPSTSGLVITTVHRFADQGHLSDRADITVMVDEAHRTQGIGDEQLGGQMRTALPNATLLGLTGTPVTDGDRNTFEAFGSDADEGRVMHRYNAADSVRDGTTVPLVIDRRRIVQTLNRDELDESYAAYVAHEGLSSTKAELLAKTVTRWNTLLKDPRRIAKVATDVAQDLTANVLPGGYGAMLVVADREACVLYATKLKELLGPGQVTAVISGTKADDDSYDPYVRDAADEAAVVRAFRDPTNPLKLLIVTSKLLTGFDARNCLATYIDKPMRGTALFQAITRVNRTWVGPSGVEKGYGIVVDYCGVAPEILRAFDQGTEDTTRKEIVSPTQLVASFKRSLRQAEKVLGDDFDWTAGLNGVIAAAKRRLSQDPKLWRMFRQNTYRAELIFEAIPSNTAVRAQKGRLQRLVQILDSYGKEALTERESLQMAHGPAVRALVLAHTGDPERADLKLLSLTPERIQELVGTPGNTSIDLVQIQGGEAFETIRERLKACMQGPNAAHYSSIAEKLELFASTVYVENADGVQQAALDLVEIAKQLKEIDDLVGEQWEALDLELFGWRTAPPAVLDPKRALRQLLDEYGPTPLPAGLDDVAKVIDDIVGTLSYKNLLDDVSAQKQLNRMLLRESARLGILPTDKVEASEFVHQLVAYVNAYLV
jgi:type I restriction enzyme, R subunit